MKPFFKPVLSCALLLVGPVAGNAKVESVIEPGWKNESQAGLVLTTGNSDTTTANAKHESRLIEGRNTTRFFGEYLSSSASNTTTAKAWRLGVRYDRQFNDTFGYYVGQSVLGDRFKGTLQQYDTDLGLKALAARSDDFVWTFESGYRFTAQRTLSDRFHKHFLRAYTELENRLNAAVSTKFWLEALPSLSDSADWQVNAEASLSAMISETFSLKTAYLMRYDNQPNEAGLKKSDSTLTTALVAQF